MSICENCEKTFVSSRWSTGLRKFCSFGCFMRGNAGLNSGAGVIFVLLAVFLIDSVKIVSIGLAFQIFGFFLLSIGIIGIILRTKEQLVGKEQDQS